MSALAAIGGAVVEVIGLSPKSFHYKSKAIWAQHAVFDAEPFWQATGMGPRTLTVSLATRPHVMGGMSAYAILKAHHEAQDVVPYLRLAAGFVGEMMGDVAITDLSHEEEKIAPDGVGRRHVVEAELAFVGNAAGGFL